jgi:hypothetical protein
MEIGTGKGTGTGTGVLRRVGPFTSMDSMGMGMRDSIDLTLAATSPPTSVCAATPVPLPVPAPAPVPVTMPDHLDLNQNLKMNTSYRPNTSGEHTDRDADVEQLRASEGTGSGIGCGTAGAASSVRVHGPFSSLTAHTSYRAPASPAPAAVVAGSTPLSSSHSRNTASDMKPRNKSPKKVSKFFSKISIDVRICTALH